MIELSKQKTECYSTFPVFGYDGVAEPKRVITGGVFTTLKTFEDDLREIMKIFDAGEVAEFQYQGKTFKGIITSVTHNIETDRHSVITLEIEATEAMPEFARTSVFHPNL